MIPKCCPGLDPGEYRFSEDHAHQETRTVVRVPSGVGYESTVERAALLKSIVTFTAWWSGAQHDSDPGEFF